MIRRPVNKENCIYLNFRDRHVTYTLCVRILYVMSANLISRFAQRCRMPMTLRENPALVVSPDWRALNAPTRIADSRGRVFVTLGSLGWPHTLAIGYLPLGSWSDLCEGMQKTFNPSSPSDEGPYGSRLYARRRTPRVLRSYLVRPCCLFKETRKKKLKLLFALKSGPALLTGLCLFGTSLIRGANH